VGVSGAGASGASTRAALARVEVRVCRRNPDPELAEGRDLYRDKLDKLKVELAGTGRFEWARAGSRGRPSHSFCLCASASLLRITLGVLMVGTSKILPPPKIRFMG